MSTIIMKYFLFFLSLPALLMAQQERFHWDFRDADTGVSEWLSVWKTASKAAMMEGALTVMDPPGEVAGNHRALLLTDLMDSSVEKVNDEAGTPALSWDFDPVSDGILRFRAGTSGTQNQNASFILSAKGRPLLIIRLVNNHSGMIISRSGNQGFEDAQSWFNRARDFEVRWKATGEVTFTFTPESGEPAVFAPLTFLAPGSPDNLRLQVGFGRATQKALRIESLQLTKNPPTQEIQP